MILIIFASVVSSMTIDILFMAKNQLVLRVNMCASSFCNKILNELKDEEIEEGVLNDDDEEIFTNKEFIRKIWYACVKHGYISEDYDIMGQFLDMLKVTP